MSIPVYCEHGGVQVFCHDCLVASLRAQLTQITVERDELDGYAEAAQIFAKERDALAEKLKIAVEGLEEIGECHAYVESQSTGMRQFFLENGAHIARRVLTLIRGES